MAPTRDSQGVEIWGICWLTVLLNDLRTVCAQPLLRAVRAEAPSCWKVNPVCINCLQSTISLISILFTGTHELLLLLHPCSRSDCIRILSACDTFPILTALTKCWLKHGC